MAHAQANPLPDKKLRYKHQIGFLAWQADLDAPELEAKQGKGFAARSSTSGRYGW